MKIHFKGHWSTKGLLLSDDVVKKTFRVVFDGRLVAPNTLQLFRLLHLNRELTSSEFVNLEYACGPDGTLVILSFSLILGSEEVILFLDDFQKIIPPNFSVQIIEVEEEVKEEEN
jgi:hypothetical protein